jgi:hypothetical protein
VTPTKSLRQIEAEQLKHDVVEEFVPTSSRETSVPLEGPKPAAADTKSISSWSETLLNAYRQKRKSPAKKPPPDTRGEHNNADDNFEILL